MFVLRLLSSVRHCRAAAFVTLRSADAIKLADWMQISPGSCCLLSDDITQVSSTVERRACGQVTENSSVWFYLWGIPMMTFSTPFSDDLSMMVFRAGIRDSQPSRPKRFSADHFFCRNSSNLNTSKHAGYSQRRLQIRLLQPHRVSQRLHVAVGDFTADIPSMGPA